MRGRAATVIHEARTRADLSQRELARRAGTSQAVISAYENGRRDPTVTQLNSVIRAAGYELQLRLLGSPTAGRANEFPDVWQQSDSSEEDDRILDNLRLSAVLRIRKMGELRDFA